MRKNNERGLIKRAITNITAFSMALTLMGGIANPAMVHADVEFTKSATNTTLGTSGIDAPTAPANKDAVWTGSYVWFGQYDKDYLGNAHAKEPIKYRVLAPYTEDYGGKTMLLDCDWVLWKDKFDDHVPLTNVWKDSSIKAKLNSAAFLLDDSYFSPAERNAIAKSTRNSDTSGSLDNPAIFYAPLNEDTVFLLDGQEATNRNYGYSNGVSYVNNRKKLCNYGTAGSETEYETAFDHYRHWWLRSPLSDGPVACLYYEGHIGAYYADQTYYPDADISNQKFGPGISPAFNIDLSKVLFATRIKETDGSNKGEYKLTVKDSSITAQLQSGKSPTISGNLLTIPYTAGGSFDHISVIVTEGAYNDPNAKIRGYFTKATNTLSGEPSFDISGCDLTGRHIYFFAEKVHNREENIKLTDYASAPVELTPVKGVSLSQTSATLTMGRNPSVELTATLNPTYAGNQNVSWRSTDASVAKVTSNGLKATVTALKKGSTNIIVTTADGGYTATCKVTVNNVDVTGIKLDKTSGLVEINTPVTLTATISPADATIKTVNWTSSNTAVATVTPVSGNPLKATVKALKPGTTTITATTADGGKKATFTATVPDPNPATVTLKPTSLKMNKGTTGKLTATVKPKGAYITWESSKPGVATVDQTGLVKALANGKAEIRVKNIKNKVVATCKVTVTTAKLVTSIKFDKKSYTIKKLKGTVTIKATVKPTKAANKKLIWESSDPNIASVTQKGVVKGKKEGTVTITATAADGGGASQSVKVKVELVRIKSITLKDTKVAVGKKAKLKATIKPSNAANKKLRWETSDPSKVTVDKNGNVKGKAAGEAYVTAFATDGSGQFGTCKITVTSKKKK